MENFTLNASHKSIVQPKEQTLAYIRYVARVYRVERWGEDS